MERAVNAAAQNGTFQNGSVVSRRAQRCDVISNGGTESLGLIEMVDWQIAHSLPCISADSREQGYDQKTAASSNGIRLSYALVSVGLTGGV